MKHKLVIWNPAIKRNTWLYRTLGPYSVASWLRQHGAKAQVIEWVNKWNYEELCEVTSAITQDNGFVGVSSTFWGPAEPDEIRIAREHLKKIRPDIKFVIGGARHYVAPEGAYDITIKSFGEDEAIKRFNHGLGQIWHPSLEKEQFYEGDAILPGESLPLSLGRGCRFACKFCSYPLIGRKAGTYERTLENILLDWKARKKLGASSQAIIVDDTINESDARLELLEGVKAADPDFGWGGYMRADLIWAHEHQQTRLPAAGLKTTFHGIESLHPKASMAIGKGWSGKHAKEWLPKLYNEIWNGEITTALSFITGLPEESADHMRETHQWVKDNFKMASWRYCALTIARDNRDWPSVFDKEAEKYGYSFPYPDKPNHWVHSTMDYYQALQLEWELSKDQASIERVATHDYFWAINMGATSEQAMSMTRSSPEFENLLSKQDQVFSAYVNKFKQIHL